MRSATKHEASVDVSGSYEPDISISSPETAYNDEASGSRLYSLRSNISSTSMTPKHMNESTPDEGVRDFFTEDDGQSLLDERDIDVQYTASISSRTATNPSLLTVSTARSIFRHRNASNLSFAGLFRRNSSATSVNTIVPLYGTFLLSINELRHMILDHTSLQRAEIVSSEGYVESAVSHRFLILELRRARKKPIWLRLERRAGRSFLGLVGALGSVPTRDTAQMASDKSRLIGGGRLENSQLFPSPPTLGELQYFLQVINEELTMYKIWSENCWFFCSLLQQHLGASEENSFVSGTLQFATLAPAIRKRVDERLRLVYHMPAAFSITELLESFRRDGSGTNLIPAIAASRRWELLAEFGSSQGRVVAHRLHQSLNAAAERYFNAREHLEAHYLWRQCVALSRALQNQDRARYSSTLAHSLSSYGVSFHAQGRLTEACDVKLEAIAIVRSLCDEDAAQYQPILVTSLYEYAAYLRKAKRFQEACDASDQAVRILRQLQTQESDKYQPELADALCGYCASLYGASRIEDACAAVAESSALRGQLHKSDPSRYRYALSESLHMHAVCLLRVTPRTKETRDSAVLTSGEAVIHRRELLDLCKGASCYQLAISLQCYSMALYESGLLGMACNAEAEAIVLLQGLVRQGEGHHRFILSDLLKTHNGHLSEAGREPLMEAMDILPPSASPATSSDLTSLITQSDTFSLSPLNTNVRPSIDSRRRRSMLSETWFKLLERWSTFSPNLNFVREQLSLDDITPEDPQSIGGLDISGEWLSTEDARLAKDEGRIRFEMQSPTTFTGDGEALSTFDYGGQRAYKYKVRNGTIAGNGTVSWLCESADLDGTWKVEVTPTADGDTMDGIFTAVSGPVLDGVGVYTRKRTS